MERYSCPETEGAIPKSIPVTFVPHGPTTLKVMHCSDLASAKTAVITLAGKHGHYAADPIADGWWQPSFG
jgi:hypothetical protein